MGHSVLTYQFITGLRPDIKIKLAGVEGTFEQLLAKAQLEVAKLRDLSEQASRSHSLPRKVTHIPKIHTTAILGEKE